MSMRWWVMWWAMLPIRLEWGVAAADLMSVSVGEWIRGTGDFWFGLPVLLATPSSLAYYLRNLILVYSAYSNF